MPVCSFTTKMTLAQCFSVNFEKFLRSAILWSICYHLQTSVICNICCFLTTVFYILSLRCCLVKLFERIAAMKTCINCILGIKEYLSIDELILLFKKKKITFRGRFFLSTLSKEFFDEAVNIDNCVFVESYFNWSIRWSKNYFPTRTLTFTISKLHSHIQLKKGICKEHLKTSCWSRFRLVNVCFWRP